MYNLKLKRDFIKRIFSRKKEIETIEEKSIYQYIIEAEQIIDELYKDSPEKFEQLYTTAIKDELKTDEFRKKLEELRNTIQAKTGKIPTTNQLINILNIDEKNITITAIDEYLDKIDIIMNQLKVIRRNSDKPMMTPRAKIFFGKGKSEAHLTTRGIHQEQVEKLSVYIAKKMGLNEGFIKIGARHHDDGHTSSGHTGERIASIIGYLDNCAYIVHNALSADIPISEGVFLKVVEMIKKEEGEITPERESQIKSELWKILDIAISHNGEGKERIIYYNPNKTVQDIIDDKNKCYTEPGYDKKIVPGSKEAAVVVFADRISYVRTDILDGVNLGILKEFDDNYLKYIGLLAIKHEKNEKFISIIEKVFETEENLERDINNILNNGNNEFIDFKKLSKETVNEIVKSLPKDKVEELTKKIEEYKINKKRTELLYEATTKYGKAYVSKIPIEKRTETVADMIKDVTTEDLIEYSKDKEYVGLSPMAAKAFFGIRMQNLQQIVKFTRRKYERELLPKAEYKVHKDLKNALIETGIIRQYLEYREKKDAGKVTEKERKIRKKLGLTDKELTLKDHAKTIDLSEKTNTKLKILVDYMRKLRFERKVCHKFMKLFKDEPERLEEIYNNCIKAAENISKEDMKLAIDAIRQDQKVQLKKDSDILPVERIEKIENIIKNIKDEYPNGFSDEDIQEYTEELIERRKANKEELFASAVALEYVAGMADTTLLEAALLKRYMNFMQLMRGNERGAKAEQAVHKMGQEWSEEGTGISAIENALSEKEER